jgi:DNA-binding NarL/FixJ family response regulator
MCLFIRPNRADPHLVVNGHTALIVDDDEDMRWLVRTTMDLSDEIDIRAEEVSGFDALERWRAGHHDLVVLDYRMPGVNGLDLAEAMLAERPEQDVILFSAYLDEAAVRRAEKLGVRGVLSKERVREIPGIVRMLFDS